MHPGIPRLVLVAPMVAALAVTLTAGAPAHMAGTETPALRSISSRLDGALSTVLIEASEPVAYLTSQPDPLTVLVDLRNVTIGSLASESITNLLEPIGSVRVEAGQRAGRRTGCARPGRPRARSQASDSQRAKHDPRRSRSQARAGNIKCVRCIECSTVHRRRRRLVRRTRSAASPEVASAKADHSAPKLAGELRERKRGPRSSVRCASARWTTATRSRSWVMVRSSPRRWTRPTNCRIAYSSTSQTSPRAPRRP